MGIGNDADYDMLKDFASEDTEKISGTDKLCFKAEHAADIVKVFKLISVSISQTVSQNSKSFPNVTPPPKPTSPDEDDEYL